MSRESLGSSLMGGPGHLPQGTFFFSLLLALGEGDCHALIAVPRPERD